MKIYFACSITGGRQFEPVYQSLVAALLADGHEVPTAHLAYSGVASEAVLSPRYVYERDAAWIRESDALIAEVSVPSHGVGYEIAYALEHEKRVLCLYREGHSLSKMISGNPHACLQVHSYAGLEAAEDQIRAFLAEISL